MTCVFLFDPVLVKRGSRGSQAARHAQCDTTKALGQETHTLSTLIQPH